MRKIIFLLLFAAVVGSCKKDNKPPVSTSNKPLLITTYAKVDINNPADTIEKFYYQYDDSNRLVKVYRWSSPGVKSLYYGIVYDAAGNISRAQGYNGSEVVEDYVVVFSNGLPLTKTYSPAGSGGSYIQSFKYINNNNTAVGSYNIAAALDTITYSNGNLVYHGTKTNSGANLYLNYAYGTHHGPYSSNNFKYYFDENLPIVSKNEILSSSGNGSVGPTKNYQPYLKYSYTYNSQGYPIKGIISDSTAYNDSHYRDTTYKLSNIYYTYTQSK